MTFLSKIFVFYFTFKRQQYSTSANEKYKTKREHKLCVLVCALVVGHFDSFYLFRKVKNVGVCFVDNMAKKRLRELA